MRYGLEELTHGERGTRVPVVGLCAAPSTGHRMAGPLRMRPRASELDHRCFQIAYGTIRCLDGGNVGARLMGSLRWRRARMWFCNRYWRDASSVLVYISSQLF